MSETDIDTSGDPFSSKKIVAQAAKIVPMAIDSNGYFVTGVTELDGTHGKKPIDVPLSVLHAVASAVDAKMRALAAEQDSEIVPVSFMLIAVGPKHCTVLVHVVPNDLLLPREWTDACKIQVLEEKLVDTGHGNRVGGQYVAEFPIKAKDEIIGAACAYLRSKKLLTDESDDERPPFDINDDN